MQTTALSAATEALRIAGLRLDAAVENVAMARLHDLGRTTISHLERIRAERAAEVQAAKVEVEGQYFYRHDLHVAEDGCLLCEGRPYSLHSTEATDAEREWAASMHADSRRALGL